MIFDEMQCALLITKVQINSAGMWVFEENHMLCNQYRCNKPAVSARTTKLNIEHKILGLDFSPCAQIAEERYAI